MKHHHNLISHTEQKVGIETENLQFNKMMNHLITIQMLRIPHPNIYQNTKLTSFKDEVAETTCLTVVIKIKRRWSQVSSVHLLKLPLTTNIQLYPHYHYFHSMASSSLLFLKCLQNTISFTCSLIPIH